MTIMKSFRMCEVRLPLIIAGVCFLTHAQKVITVEDAGRRIQRDGFLMEWRLDKAHTIDARTDMRLDAMNTPEGLAGYVRFSGRDTCNGWIFRFYPRLGAWQRFIEISADTSSASAGFHAADIIHSDSVVHAAIEWILPWDSLPRDPAGAYSIGMQGHNNCGDTVGGIIFSGVLGAHTPPARNSTGLINQVILIGVLLALYLFFKARSKKIAKGLKRDSLR